MINSAIFWKTFRDSAPMIIASTFGLIAFVVLFVWAMLDMGQEMMAFLSKFEFLKKIFEFGFGIDLLGEISVNILFAICFTHGVVMILSWSCIIATASRVTAGEIERGTADLLLTLPVTRREVYFSTALVWVLSTLILAASPVIGIWIGSQIFETDEPVEIAIYFAPALNFLFVLLAIGGISSLVSSLIDRRGLAVAVIAGFLLISVVLNFMEPFIEIIKRIRFLGLLTYFRPVDVVRTGEWPIVDMIVLFGMAATCWTIGLRVFCRKDIPTA